MESKYKFKNYIPSTVTFYNQERDMLLREQSLIAIMPPSDCIVALGEEAETAGRHDETIIVGSPLRNGVVADFDLAGNLFKFFLYRANGKRFFKPKIAVCVPVDMTQVERRALTEMLQSIGAKKVLIIEESYEKAAHVIPSEYGIVIEILP